MGKYEPKSQSLSLQVWGRAWWARESSVSCKEGPQEPGGQQGRRSPQSIRTEPPVADDKGDQRGVEQLLGVWSSAISAMAWSLPRLDLERGVLHPSGSLGKSLGTPDGKQGISPETYL